MMEFLIGAISLASLILNVLIYRKLRESIPGTLQELEVEPIELVEREAEVGEVLPPIEPVITTPMVQEVYQGWRNQTGIEWSPAKPPPPPVQQPTSKGPLARPDGFV